MINKLLQQLRNHLTWVPIFNSRHVPEGSGFSGRLQRLLTLHRMTTLQKNFAVLGRLQQLVSFLWLSAGCESKPDNGPMTFDVLGPPKNLLGKEGGGGAVSLEQTEHLLHFFIILSRPLTFSIQPQIRECVGDSDVPKFSVWRNQMLLVWRHGVIVWVGPNRRPPP